MKYHLQFETDKPLSRGEVAYALLTAAYRMFKHNTNDGNIEHKERNELVGIWTYTETN